MKLIAVNTSTKEVAVGYVDFDKDHYARFAVKKGEAAKFDRGIPKKNYRDYDHFVGVAGKFDPYTVFFKVPRPLKEVTVTEVYRVYQEFLAEG